MYDLTKIQDIKNYLITISPTFDEVGDHYVICCPYCDDAIRKTNIDHGHCYISKTIPVFYCHRCDSTGTILDLLQIIEYNNSEVLNDLKQIIKFKIGKNYLRINIINKSKLKINQFIYDKLQKIGKDNLNQYYNYLQNRIGYINFVKFFLFPDIIDDQLVVGFMNYDGYIISYRFIQDINGKRYKKKSNNYYYFQNINQISEYENIIICEGQFDLISLYLYNRQFDQLNSFYICCNGKNYINLVKNLIYDHLFLSNININIVFDNDTPVYWRKSIIRRLNIVTSKTSNKIFGLKPKYLKDSNDCSELEFI